MDSNKRPETMARIATKEQAEQFIAEQVEAVRKQVGDKKVLLALSGGVDSSVVAALQHPYQGLRHQVGLCRKTVYPHCHPQSCGQCLFCRSA